MEGVYVMQTIIIKLDSKKLENPDLDMIYQLPDVLDEYTNHRVSDNGYDYLSDTEIGIWLSCEDAKQDVMQVITYLSNHKICGNDLTKSAEIYISEKDCADLNECKKIYPKDDEVC